MVVGDLGGVGVDDLHITALVKGGRGCSVVGEVNGLENVLQKKVVGGGRGGREGNISNV